jgi:TrmH family RNA methyltransferase
MHDKTSIIFNKKLRTRSLTEMEARNILANIRIVLIQTSHPGNIGSAARAMKTMGLSTLYLVRPKSFPDVQATTMSSNAHDVLDNAVVVEHLQDALVGCKWVVGSSARDARSLTWDVLDARSCGEQVVKKATTAKVALVFGRESSGITNDELALCHSLVHIPTNPEYSSLNLASAVQLLSYECRVASQSLDAGDQLKQERGADVVTVDAMESYYQHLETSMIEAGFLDPENPKHLMTRLRRLYARTEISSSELNILRGMLVAFQKK